MSTGAEPVDSNGRPIEGWDSINHRPAVTEIDTTSVDPDGIAYGYASVQDMIQSLARAGKSFVTSTGPQTSTGTFTEGLSVFNPSGSGKTLYFFSAKAGVASARLHSLYQSAADPTLGTALTPVNALAGSATTSAASVSYTNAAANISTAGDTLIETMYTLADAETDFLDTDEIKICPPGYGLLIAVSTATNAWAATLKWVEN